MSSFTISYAVHARQGKRETRNPMVRPHGFANTHHDDRPARKHETSDTGRGEREQTTREVNRTLQTPKPAVLEAASQEESAKGAEPPTPNSEEK